MRIAEQRSAASRKASPAAAPQVRQQESEKARRGKKTARAKSSKSQQNQEEWLPGVGDTVYVPSLGSEAKIVGLTAGGKLEVQAGFMRISVAKGEVTRARY